MKLFTMKNLVMKLYNTKWLYVNVQIVLFFYNTELAFCNGDNGVTSHKLSIASK